MTQITDMLDTYQAKMAHVLHVKCGDIGQLASGKRIIDPDTKAWKQALLFIRFYRVLYEKMKGDGIAIRN